MKIMIITETFLPSTDGVVTRLTHAISFLLDQGHEVIVVAPDLGVKEYKGAIVEGMRTTPTPFYRNKEFALWQRKVKKVIKKHDPDLIHAVNPAIMGVSGVHHAYKLGYPLIASYHTNLPKYLDYYKIYKPMKPIFWSYLRKYHNKASINLCTSETVRKELQAKDFHNVHVWERGVDIGKYHPDYYNEKMRMRLSGGEPEKKLLVFIGRLAIEKEIHRIRPLLDSRKDIRLAIVGDGPARKELEETFRGTDTVFTGFIHGTELSQAFASADAFVFPSVTETLGLVILEAMAAGLPVIAAKSGPTLEQIDEGQTGLLYEYDKIDTLIKAVDKLTDTDFMNQLKRNAREEAEKHSWTKPSSQLLGFYEELLNRHPK